MRWQNAVNIGDLRELARRRLPRFVFDYVDGGAEDERTLRGNAAAFERLAWRRRTLVNVAERSTAATLFGRSAAMPVLNKGEGDVIIGIIVTDARRKLVDFTSEVLPARHQVITWQPHRVVSTLEEFRAEKVGVVKGTSWSQAALDAGIAADSMEYFADRYQALDALKARRITATVMTLSDFTLSLKKYPGGQAGMTLGAASTAAFAVRKGDQQLLAALDVYPDNLRKGPSWSRLVVKYFGEKALAVLGRK